MTSMFWGLRLEPGKKYSTIVDKSFHVSMAALECSTVKSDNEILSVMIDDFETNVPFILCNLQKNKMMQSPLDLNFMSGDRITLFCKGSGIVHLSGYIAPEDDDDDELGQVSEEDEVDEEVDNSDNEELKALKGKGKINGVQGKRRVNDLTNPQTKRKKLEKMDEDTDDSDDEDDDIASDDLEDESLGLEGDESDDDDDDDGDMEEDESENEEVEEEEDNVEEGMPSKSTQHLKKNKKNRTQVQQSAGQSKQNTTSNKQNQGKQKTPNGLSSNTEAKKDKKKGDKTSTGTSKLNKSNDESRSPAGKKGAEVEPSSGKKSLDGGVLIKDIKVGNGPICKSGKMACVYYTGRLKQNNKVFDSTIAGPGFKFRVGKGEVIKGWDIGVVGMKVGGKRLITCPPPMAYGQKGSPPTIPVNSTLVFEVELKGIN